MRYDLHLHSTASDGALSPEELISLCADRGVQIVALTDHDTIDGLHVAQLKANELGLHLITGAEFSCRWRRQTLHVLGLGFDHHADEVQSYMSRLQVIRRERSEKIAIRLIKKGVDNSILDQAKQIAGDTNLCRPHFAKALLKMGYVRSVKEAFDLYLGQGKAGDVQACWPDLEEVVTLIKKAGGVTVLAHPTKYKMTFTRLRLLFDDLKALGADAVEISYPGLNPDQGRELSRWVKHYGFLVSAGSDFHTATSPWTLPGSFPEINVNEKHVLSQLLTNQSTYAL